MKTVKKQTNTNIKAAPPPLDKCYKAAPLEISLQAPPDIETITGKAYIVFEKNFTF